MNYTLHQLQVFLKVAQHQSITKASEELHLTQPAVSIQLKKFQDQFSIPLTEVVGRQLYITEFGKEIAEAAQKILNEVYAINYKTLSYKGKLTGRLNISIASTGKYVAPYFLSGFMSQHPGVDLLMDVTNKTRVVESLEKNEVDFALVSVLPKKLKVNAVELMDNKLYFVGSSQLELSNKPSKRQLFEELPLIFRESGSATRNAMEAFLAKIRLPAQKKIELTSNEAVKQAVIAGLGCSIMPLIGIKNELKNNDLQIIPVRGLPISTTWNLVWLKSKALSPVAEAYLEFVQENKNHIIADQFSWIDAY